MFGKESLVQYLAGAGCFSVIQTLLLIILGALFVSNEHYHQLLGNTIKHVGGGLIFTGLLYLLAAVLGYYGARTHNKCLLLMLFVLLAVLLFLQTVFGSVALGKSIPSLAHEMQVACLTLGLYDSMTVKQQQECDQFLHSDGFAGMTLVWQSYYTNSITKGSYRAMVLNFQKENFCCGNGLPSRCSNDTRAFPASYPSTTISTKVRQRITCDSYGTMAYAATRECNTNGRCEYDLPYGSCGLNPVATTTRGCGAFVLAKLSTQVEAIGIIVLVSLMFPISLLVASLCLCFKRRDEDVLPSIEFAPKVRVHAEG
uniref:Tetraspanin n=1 Tax=Globisporangium ultimum (strain ATCC 200006 / CBS 805.95 / DAOM BR144) TaxID=431595 RepID=K3W9V6_GLOUD